MPNDGPKSRGILMSAPMVRATLAGDKTQTRRVVLPVPTHGIVEGIAGRTVGMDPALDGKGWYDTDCIGPGRLLACPYGGIGDRLYVREAFSWARDWDESWARETGESRDVWYWADGDPDYGDWTKPKPSIHLPKHFSRLWLEITNVRVQKVQQIGEADAIAEGVTHHPSSNYAGSRRELFSRLWDSLNAKRGHGWGSNPYVWCLTFRRIERPTDA